MVIEDTKAKMDKPSIIWLLTEGGRAIFEYSTFWPYNFFKKINENGDGHPVLVLPGFMASDASTGPLRKFIDKLGYKSYKWDLGRNYGNEVYLDHLTESVQELYKLHNQKVSIVGWSLGGVYARQIAKKLPHLVRQVITLGSPFRGVDMPNHAEWIYKFITNGKTTKDVDPMIMNDLPNPAPVPTTAIYTKEDGVVPWEACMEQQESDIHQNVQVRGSHFGLGVNPTVLEIIADRLVLSEKNWQPFVPKSKMEQTLFYPSSSDQSDLN